MWGKTETGADRAARRLAAKRKANRAIPDPDGISRQELRQIARRSAKDAAAEYRAERRKTGKSPRPMESYR